MLARSTLHPRLDRVRATFPVGTRVLYRPVAGEPKQVETTIRSTPWALGHGEIVIKIDACAGGVSVDHLTIATADASSVPPRHPATTIGE
jgi:hypothetical protein